MLVALTAVEELVPLLRVEEEVLLTVVPDAEEEVERVTCWPPLALLVERTLPLEEERVLWVAEDEELLVEVPEELLLVERVTCWLLPLVEREELPLLVERVLCTEEELLVEDPVERLLEERVTCWEDELLVERVACWRPLLLELDRDTELAEVEREEDLVPLVERV